MALMVGWPNFMQLSVKLDFSPTDSTEIIIALTPEHIASSLEDFSALVKHAVELIHHNAQAYRYLAEKGTIRIVVPKEA